MALIAAVVRAASIVFLAMLAAPDAQADSGMYFGFGPHGRLAHEPRFLDKPHIIQRRDFAAERRRDHAAIEKRRFEHRHRFDHFADLPHSGSGSGALDHRHAFFHDYRSFHHRRPHLCLYRPGAASASAAGAFPARELLRLERRAEPPFPLAFADAGALATLLAAPGRTGNYFGRHSFESAPEPPAGELQ